MIEGMVVRRWVLFAAVALGLGWAFWGVYTWPTVVYGPSFVVAYSKGVGQSVELEVVNESSQPVPFCATLIGWFPNGSLIKLDDVCGVGRASVKTEPVRKYAEAWRSHDLEVGVFVLLTYINGTDINGNYTWDRAAKSFVIKPSKVLSGENVRALIKVKGKPPKTGKQSVQVGSLQGSFPPNTLLDHCFFSPSEQPTQTCYYWTLDQQYVTAINQPIPVVAARVASSYAASKIDNVFIKFLASASSSNKIYFSGSAAIVKSTDSGSVSVDFSIDIISMGIDRNFNVAIDNAMYPSLEGPKIIVVGFYGNYSIARYKEMICTTTGGFTHCWSTNTYAYFYIMGPVLPGRGYAGKADLNSDIGNVFNLVTSKWTPNYKYGTFYITLDSLVLVQENKGLPTLSLGIPILKEAPLPIIGKVDIEGSLAASVGTTTTVTAIGYMTAGLKDPNDYKTSILVKYYMPSVKFEFGGSYYPLPSMFVDVDVYTTSGLSREG
ncbi:MAG: hypothetical protein ABWK05_00030 [Pyrobaculum sp.]